MEMGAGQTKNGGKEMKDKSRGTWVKGAEPRTYIVTSEEGGGERENAAEHGDGVANREVRVFVRAFCCLN